MNSELLENGANMLWVDFLANGNRLSASEEREKLIRLAKEAGVTHLVVDAKIPYGHTTYPSRYAIHVSAFEILGGAVQGDRTNVQQGKWFQKWTEWRALNIKQFVQQAKMAVKSVRPDCLFSIYVGSWYPLYFHEGVNWASETYRSDLAWASPDYYRSAYADELDFIMTGCYYPEVYIQEATDNRRPAPWYSVEGAIDMSLEAINSRIPVVASLFLKDYEGNLEQFHKAVRLCRERTHGVMLFDAVYLEKYGWWQDMATVLEARF